MSERPMTVAEMARMGGIARAKAHSKAELRAWGKQGGRPLRLTRKEHERMERMLAEGLAHSEIARRFRVSLRTVGRVAATMRKEN
jgi:DNA invertase Pin-like site-specific DNA recombinase